MSEKAFKKIQLLGFGLCICLTLFLVSPVFAQLPYQEMKSQDADVQQNGLDPLIWVSVSLPDCPPTTNNKLLLVETDKKGNRLEIWCNKQYQMKIIKADGSSGWVGKCPFVRGHNEWYKLVDVNMKTLPDGKVVPDISKQTDPNGTIIMTGSEVILGTTWKSVEPVGTPPNPPATQGPKKEGRDRRWTYDANSNKYTKQETKHTGNWQWNGSKWVWVRESQKADGPPTPEKEPPKNPDLLVWAGDRHAEDLEDCVVYVPDYVVRTPFPVTTVVNGVLETNIYKLSDFGGTYEVEKIEATKGQPFSFDINMFGEDEELLTYTLISGPGGMTVNSSTGLISWTPSSAQAGECEVAIEARYHGLQPHVGSFTLRVQPAGQASSPNPINSQREVAMNPPSPLSWDPGSWVSASDGHRVYLGTSFDDVNTATPQNPKGVYMGAFDTNTYDVNSHYGQLLFNTTYYWRVDEVNDANAGSPWKGVVWNFATLSGIALNPCPADGSDKPFDINIPSLKWTPGCFAANVNGHRIFFGTDYDDVNNATSSTPIVYRGQQTQVSYPLANLVPDYFLVPGNTCYWRVDEVNDTNAWKGDVWSFEFTKEYYIDNFDVNSLPRWKKTPDWPGFCGLYAGAGTITWDQANGQLIIDYNNTGTIYDPYTEVRFQYDAGGCDWTAGSVPAGAPKLLYLTFSGNADNAADPVYDRMYVTIRDDANHQGSVCYNPDGIAQQREVRQDWRIILTDLNSPSVDLKKIRYFVMGFGDRCNPYGSGYVGGSGTVIFDNIRLSQPICNERYGPTADFYDDCFVDSNDLGVFVNDWLLTGTVLSYPDAVPPGVAPVLWYDFNETDGNLVHNTGSGGNAYDANVNMYIDGNNRVMHNNSTWDAGGHIGRCINLVYGAQSFVNVPPEVLVPFADANGPDAITFTCWVNMDAGAVLDVTQPGLISAADESEHPAAEVLCPTPRPPAFAGGPTVWFNMTQWVETATMRPGDFGGRWNHYAVVKDADANAMSIYHNGAIIALWSSSDVAKPLLATEPVVFKIGARYDDSAQQPFGPWGPWPGKIDDFRMYNYALNANEIAYLATDGTGAIYVPLAEPTNLKSSTPEIINFGDFAFFANQWLTEQLWP